MRWWVLLLCAVLWSCAHPDADGSSFPPTPGPPSDPFWVPLDLSGATDLGHTPQMLPESAAGPVALTDVTEAAGLAGAIGGGNSHGVGIAFLDLDADTFPDIFIANGIFNSPSATWFPSKLYRNNGDGTFSDVSTASGIEALLPDGTNLFSVAAGDYDNDGDPDLYLGAQPNDILLANNGDGTFVNATAAAQAGGPASDPSLVADGRSKIGSFGDYDADGNLDLVSASSTLEAPGAYVLHNDGAGTFTDVTASSGVAIHPTGNPCAVLWTDYDNDARADLWIWNDRGGHVLLHNEGAGIFDNVTTTALDSDIRHPMGIDGADIDHDGDLDYYVSNIGNNPLLRNEGNGTFNDITYWAKTGGEFGWGLGFEDFNLDTWPDLFVAQEDDRPYIVFTNNGEGDWSSFSRSNVDHAPIVSGGRAHNVAVAFADYDQDGRTDVVTTTTDSSRINLYRNETDVGSNNSLEVVVISPDTGQYGAVGARVYVHAGGLTQFREITGGSSRASQNELSVRFGLGPVSGADWVVVQWPSGDQIAFTNVEAGRFQVPSF